MESMHMVDEELIVQNIEGILECCKKKKKMVFSCSYSHTKEKASRWNIIQIKFQNMDTIKVKYFAIISTNIYGNFISRNPSHTQVIRLFQKSMQASSFA